MVSKIWLNKCTFLPLVPFAIVLLASQIAWSKSSACGCCRRLMETLWTFNGFHASLKCCVLMASVKNKMAANVNASGTWTLCKLGNIKWISDTIKIVKLFSCFPSSAFDWIIRWNKFLGFRFGKFRD